MNNATPRLKALLAGGAALVVFGITVPATATDGVDTGGRPDVGSVGSAGEKANPKGQSNNDHNNGFTCDENKGAGVAGNPALPHDCGSGYGGGGTGTDTGTGTGSGDTWTNPGS